MKSLLAWMRQIMKDFQSIESRVDALERGRIRAVSSDRAINAIEKIEDAMHELSASNPNAFVRWNERSGHPRSGTITDWVFWTLREARRE